MSTPVDWGFATSDFSTPTWMGRTPEIHTSAYWRSLDGSGSRKNAACQRAFSLCL
jgi:hypothetical protein